MKKLLFIVNPRAGRTRSLAPMFDVVARFSQAGYLIKLFTTESPGDAKRAASELGGDFDLVVCAGGDGTLNETLCGLMTLEHRPPVGYIPHGSTNDFAASLHIPAQPMAAANAIAACTQPKRLDLGQHNGRYFAYVASFGAFTRASYSATQAAKNALELSTLIGSLTRMEYDAPGIIFRHVAHVTLATDDIIPWSLDGEYAASQPKVEIRNLHHAIELMV